MFKALVVASWFCFALDTFLVIAAIVTRDAGDDAAGRGVARSFGLIGLAIVVIGGTGLYFSGRSHTWVGLAASSIPLMLPLLFIFGTQIEGVYHDIGVRISNSKVGRYPEPAQRELAKAIEAADFTAMRKILTTLPNLNGHDQAGFNLLGYAVAECLTIGPDRDGKTRIEAVRLLLDAGMDPNRSAQPNNSSSFASLAGQLTEPVNSELFLLFLRHGADPNTKGDLGKPVIFWAWESPECLSALADRGADLNVADEDGDTPLLFFLRNARWDAALVMLERGADLNVKSKYDTTPLTGLEKGRALNPSEPAPPGYKKVKAELERRLAVKR